MVTIKIKPKIIISLCFLITACVTPLQEGAEEVLIVNVKPAEKICEFLGQISASEGGMVSGDFMRDSKIKLGAINQLKNKALLMGGNAVYIEENFNALTHLTPRTLNQTNIGLVYRCTF